ncbi:hypothetical protein PoB_005826900 [Plakobranchus ocellatus]|uniref:Uncharacterized protein n=1 Tax=Plakobranchus ocellatus TaxID=259542 RepID=A0AAV4CKP4_9GAST|nr:hypothetical protein PoB_005826900 [Plakobranchus ocellatus]
MANNPEKTVRQHSNLLGDQGVVSGTVACEFALKSVKFGLSAGMKSDKGHNPWKSQVAQSEMNMKKRSDYFPEHSGKKGPVIIFPNAMALLTLRRSVFLEM